MPFLDSPTNLVTALSAPLDDVISAVGASVADAQAAMDAQTIDNLRKIYSDEGDLLESLRSIGYQPTFYQIPEVTAEVSVALTVTGEAETSQSSSAFPAGTLVAARTLRPVRLLAAPVDASYTNKFNYNLQAATQVKFRIVPVPPTPAAEALRVAPDVVGQTLAEARELLDSLDVPFTFDDGASEPEDSAQVTAQTPAPGTVLGPADSVVLFFAEPAP